MVSGERDINITWQPFSLAIKNDVLPGGGGSSDHAELYRSSHRVLRVLLAAHKGGAQLVDLYTDFGIARHLSGDDFTDELIARIVQRRQLPAACAQAADDVSYDSAIRASMNEALELTGQDVGVPIIVFENKDGSKNGYFGPVLQTLPDLEESLALWDGLSALAANTNFYELKRTRPSGNPDVYSTAKC